MPASSSRLRAWSPRLLVTSARSSSMPVCRESECTGVVELSKATYAKMVQNLVWATAYNLVAIPIAAGALSFAGISLPPAAAAVAMSLSTIVVALNAQLLRRLDLRSAPIEDSGPSTASIHHHS